MLIRTETSKVSLRSFTDAKNLSGALVAKDRHNLVDTGEGGFTPPAGVRLVPTEQVLLLTVTLPQMPAAQRRVAVAFAVEDQIARPLDDVHAVLGPQVGAAWLVAVVAREVLAGWPAGRLVADVGMVPVPAAGEWSVLVQGARALVRCADGTGFATDAGAFGVYHLAAGRPALIVYGQEMPEGFVASRRDVLPAMDARFARFDLNAARVQSYATCLPRGWRRLAGLLAVAAVGHLALVGIDTLALMRLRDAQVAAVREAAGLAEGASVEAAVAQTMAAQPGAAPSTFLPQMIAIFAAMETPLAVRDLRYLGDAGSITITVEAQDITTLQATETALNDAGLTVAAGAATSSNGLAEQQLTITGGAP
jgi:general secretion pathway protein L